MAGSVRTVFDSTPANTRRLCFDYIPMWCEHAMQLLCSHDGLEAVARRPARVKRTNEPRRRSYKCASNNMQWAGRSTVFKTRVANGEEDRRSHWRLGCWSSGSVGARASNRLTSIRVQSVHAYRTLFLPSYTSIYSPSELAQVARWE